MPRPAGGRLRAASEALPDLPPPIRRDPHPGGARLCLHGLYDALWYAAAILAAPWLAWRGLRDPGFAAMVAERTGWRPPPPAPEGAAHATGPRVMVHGVSVGEVKGAAPLVRALAERFPGIEVAVSSTTNTGMTVAREVFRGRRVVRFPADTTRSVRRFLDRVRPELVILVELEIWPNFLRECNRRGIPVAVVMGRITESAHKRYRLFRHLLPQFDRLSLICVQDELYARRFRDLAVDPARVRVTGSMKADRLALGPVDPGAELVRLLGGRPGQLVIVAGSTHEPEETLVAEAWRAGAPDARLVLVPRHPERAPDVLRALERVGLSAQRLTDLRAGRERPDPERPCVADTIGELERIYGLADLVFVGGSLAPHGGHDLLEPAAQGRAVLIGPHVTNFAQETALFVERDACVQVADAEALARALRALGADRDARAAMAQRGLEVVRGQKGATAATLAALGVVLGGEGTEAPRRAGSG